MSLLSIVTSLSVMTAMITGLPLSIGKLGIKNLAALLGDTSVERDTSLREFVPPDSVNWVDEGYVTPVKYQGTTCNSGWAFSTVGAVEGQILAQYGPNISLSAQQLIDCTVDIVENACKQGSPQQAFDYMKKAGGIEAAATYPYEGHNNTCRSSGAQHSVATLSGYVDIASGNEEALKMAVATVGPSGIYYEEKCSKSELNHGVLVVGYGTTEAGENYWLVKNSYSRFWGDRGYIRMARNSDNNCGIATAASYPILKRRALSVPSKFIF